MIAVEVEGLLRLCKKPNNIKLLLAIEGEVKQDDVYRRGPVPAGAFYGSLKDLMSLGLVERVKRDVYYLRLTEKGLRVRELLVKLAEELAEEG